MKIKKSHKKAKMFIEKHFVNEVHFLYSNVEVLQFILLIVLFLCECEGNRKNIEQ